ncbi:alpha-D-ribose 1-methylphosphonate 5-triphosphate synthase subunit PhnG [Rhodanobacter sp. K2T2]|uniref:phosphonate C-P lyase system protein PhnG n=1 Tax=Rhodanobacter sp. K2T2 TaxID=2723085 RepID=UPI0015C834BD|nr:phosphonate C-P lyase system protein PhnG [Rhodanobacter sp. K2T2]NYE31141.1 alpha-D-ribose 1-methylphosphonate 5-triphosphate synthase subunit PhnG [Rhodanobacter sp. K2T2]
MDTCDHLARAQWMSLLAQAEADELMRAMEAFSPALDGMTWLRPAQTGLYMMRGRIGGTGEQFNLGEVSVTRCSVQIGERIGHAWVRGGNRRHAELAACADALMQDINQRAHLQAHVVEPLRKSLTLRREAASRKAAASKVEFFTVVRGE